MKMLNRIWKECKTAFNVAGLALTLFLAYYVIAAIGILLGPK